VRPGEGLQAASGPLPEPAPEQRWVLVVIASARAWKGTSGVSPACLGEVEGSAERLHEAGAHVDVVWCTPRGVGTAGAHLPGSGPHLEHALAGLLWPREEGA
jgi:hypothetical protein